MGDGPTVKGDSRLKLGRLPLNQAGEKATAIRPMGLAWRCRWLCGCKELPLPVGILTGQPSLGIAGNNPCLGPERET